MARNIDVLKAQLGGDCPPPPTLKGIYPFHLAASFLDGAKTCCSMLSVLMFSLEDDLSITPNYRDDLGHTVLDRLFINIIRSHTSVSPLAVSDRFAGQSRFPGEEVDICGRWDADYPCLRHLYASGNATIPFKWKHPFCHTSAQATCHSINTLFGGWWSPDINTPSGLYMKRCNNCGRELSLGPLHSLVVTAFYLANNGTEGETLFGIIACLVCMLAHGAAPSQTAEVCMASLFGGEASENCSHATLKSTDLARRVSEETIQYWTRDCQLGWRVFVAILELALTERERLNKDYIEDEVRDNNNGGA